MRLQKLMFYSSTVEKQLPACSIVEQNEWCVDRWWPGGHFRRTVRRREHNRQRVEAVLPTASDSVDHVWHLLQAHRHHSWGTLCWFGVVSVNSLLLGLVSLWHVPCMPSYSLVIRYDTTQTQKPFYGPFSGTTRVSRCQKKVFFWSFVVQGEISEADTPTIWLGATPSGLISDPSPKSLHFYMGCPSCHNSPTLSWSGTVTKYAGLHTQWCGFNMI